MDNIDKLKSLANENRKRIIKMIYEGKAGHPGGSLSVIDMLTAIYEIDVNFDENPRSKVVLSKGHAVPAQYAVLCSKGVIEENELGTFRTINSRLQGHPYTGTIPEVDATTGLLGQGLSIAVGMAIAKRNNNDNHHVYAILGDGEMQEGQIWESLLQAAHYKLNNLIVEIFKDFWKKHISIHIPEIEEKYISARSEDDLIEGIEIPNKKFIFSNSVKEDLEIVINNE